MGQAKRNRDRRASEPCKCGSGKPAGVCCFDGTSYTKQPARIVLSNRSNDLSIDGCYLRHTRGCGGQLSKEHLISESVLNVLNQGDLFMLSGAAWQAAGASMKIGLSALTAKCLCERHNNTCLSALDTAAGRFFAAIKSTALNDSAPAISILISGHDIERWMLKTMFALSLGKSLARDKQLIPANFYSGIDEAQLLSNPMAWPVGSGLYSMQQVDEIVTRKDQLDLAALTIPGKDELVGLRFSIQGLAFDCLAVPPTNLSSGKPHVLHRPGRLTFRHGSIVNEVLISWVDGRSHQDVGFDFVGTVPAP